jgi:hypothetical protein
LASMQLRCLALVAAAVVALAGCGFGRETMPIGAVATEGDRIAVNGYCHSDVRLGVDESADAVELTLSAEAEDGGDCFDCIVVTLDAEVGDRLVIDSTTDAPIPEADPALAACFALVGP